MHFFQREPAEILPGFDFHPGPGGGVPSSVPPVAAYRYLSNGKRYQVPTLAPCPPAGRRPPASRGGAPVAPPLHHAQHVHRVLLRDAAVRRGGRSGRGGEGRAHSRTQTRSGQIPPPTITVATRPKPGHNTVGIVPSGSCRRGRAVAIVPSRSCRRDRPVGIVPSGTP